MYFVPAPPLPGWRRVVLLLSNILCLLSVIAPSHDACLFLEQQYAPAQSPYDLIRAPVWKVRICVINLN